MDLFMIFFTIVFLLCLAFALYLTLLQELHKKSKGIPVECESVQEIYEILAERLKCPFLTEMHMNEEQKIEFGCKYDSHIGILEDGKFYIDKRIRKFSSHREVEEAWYLQKYVEGVFCPEHEEAEILGQRFAKYIKIFNVGRVIKCAVYVCIIIWVFGKIGGMDAIRSKGVSRMCFTDYSNEITIGEALDASCSKGKWSKNKIRDGLYHVTYSGYGEDGSLLTILFQTDGNECSIKSITIGNDDVTLMQGLFLGAIYANAEGGSDRDEADELSEISRVESQKGTSETLPVADEAEGGLEKESTQGETYTKKESLGNEDILNSDWYDDDSEMELSEDEDLYDSEVQGEMDDIIPVWELSGHYAGIIGAQSVMDISIYTAESEDGSIGNADIYVEGGQYSYYANIYEVGTNLYWVAVDTGEGVFLSPYRDGEYIVMQLYVDGECITEYLLTSQFQS